MADRTEQVFDVPFYPQVWELDHWQELGFRSRTDAAYWERSSCGVLCLVMILNYFLKDEVRVSDLIADGQQLGAYTHQQGWSHQGLANLAQQHGLAARVGQFSTNDLVEALDHGILPIISIKWAFQPRKSLREWLKPGHKRGGHLALVVGYRRDGQKLEGFFIHHTSTKAAYNWPARLIELKQFEAGYTGRGLVLQKSTE